MKKTFIKATSLFLAVLMLSGIAAMGFTAFAATEYTQDNYRYTVSGGKATLTKATSISGNVLVPDTLGGYPVTAIGTSAFLNCSEMTGITIPDSVVSIGSSAFENCYALAEFTVTAGVTSVGDSAFRSCTSLKKFNVESGNTVYTTDETGVLFSSDKTKIVSYPAGNGRVEYVIPAYVESVEKYAFAGSVHLEEIIWDDPEISFGIGAFSNCTSLVRVTVPEGTTHLSDWLFNACYSLSEVNLPESLESMGSGVFHWCTDLEYIELPSGLEEISNNAFRECERLRSIKIPDGVKIIRPNAFHQCYSLESVEIPESVTQIGNTAFYQCYSLKEITFPDGIKTIDGSVLRYCVNLESFSIPESVTAVNDEAFMDCRSLETLTIPENVKTLTGKVFANCVSLEKISVDSDNAYFTAGSDGILFDKTGTKLVYYPANKQQKVYTVPDTVTAIGQYAFGSAQNLATVVIPDSVTSVEAAAFYGLNIRDIYFEGTQEEWNMFAVAADTANLKATVHFNYNGTDHIHEYSQEITVTPTCSANGKKTYACSCGENTEITYYYNPSLMICLGMSVEWKDGETADCSEPGTRSFCCSECGYARAIRDTEKPEHNLSIDISESAIDFECEDCGHSYTEEISADAGYIRYISDGKERVHIYHTGDEIVVPPTPEKGELDFFGWADENGEIVQLGTMPDKNMVLTASFGTILEESNFGLTATFDEGCFDEDVTLSVNSSEKFNELGNISMPDGKEYFPTALFNIKMVNDKSETVQPNDGKTVKLRFPIPSGYNENDDFFVTHWLSDGTRETFSNNEKDLSSGRGIKRAVVENGYIIIEIGQFSEFAIHVKTRAAITKLPSKTSYYYRENINLSGIELEVMNSDGTLEKVTDTSKMTVSGYDYSKVGTQTVTVEYEGNTVSFDVTVSYAWWQWIIRILLLGFLWY